MGVVKASVIDSDRLTAHETELMRLLCEGVYPHQAYTVMELGLFQSEMVFDSLCKKLCIQQYSPNMVLSLVLVAIATRRVQLFVEGK